MLSTSRLATTAIFALLVAPALGVAQDAGGAATTADPPGASATPPSGSPQALAVEAQALQQELQRVEQQAMQDPELQAQQQALAEAVQAEMQEIDPATEQRLARLNEAQQAAVTARQEGDQQGFQQAVGTLREVQAELQQTQAEALENETVAEKVTAFQEDVRAAMTAIDPELPEKVDRLRELAARLSASAPGAGSAPAHAAPAGASGG